MIKGNLDGKTNSNNEYNPYNIDAHDTEFINLVQNRITGYGQIQYNVPVQLIIDVIKSSAKFFFQWYSQTWHKTYYYIKTSEITRNSRLPNQFVENTINISPKIVAINKIYEVASIMDQQDDFNIFDNQSVISGSYTTVQDSGINNNLFMIENAVKMVEMAALRTMFKTTLSFNHSYLNSTLTFKKLPVAKGVLIDCHAINDMRVVYKLAYFERHVIANCKRELKRILGSQTVALPGGATLNPEEICNNIEDAEFVEEKIISSNNVGDIIARR